jgi:predicted nucleic acid-binding protein
MSPLVFVDTWAWLALALRRDQHHAEAKRIHESLTAAGRQYLTTDYVLAELATQLYRAVHAAHAERFFGAVLKTISSGTYRLETITPARFAEAWRLRQLYADKPNISFVDLTSFAVMKELGVMDAFTGDAHFAHVNLGFTVLANS